MATSGNGLELLHTKTVPKCCWVVTWAALVALHVGMVLGAYGSGSGIQAGGLSFAGGVCAVVAVLPLTQPTARSFVDALTWWLPLLLLAYWGFMLYAALQAGSMIFLVYWTPLFTTSIFLLQFRRRWFIVGFFGLGCLFWAFMSPVLCLAHASIESMKSSTYGECVEAQYQDTAATLIIQGFFVGILLGRKFANDAWSYRAAKASRDRHRF